MALTPVNQDFNVNNGLVVSGTSAVTSSTGQSNALQVYSGVAIAQNLIVGTDGKIYGNFEVAGTTTLGTSTVNGNLTVTGDIIANKLTIQLTTVTTSFVTTDDIISTYNTTTSTSTNSGALIIAGGVGIGGNVHVGGNITAPNFLGTATTAKNLEGGAAYSIPYQSTSNSTVFLPLGQDGTFLGILNQQLTWTSAGGTTVGNATTASNLAGGSAGAIPYQSNVGQTTFDAAGLRYISSLTQFVANNISVISSASGTTIGGGAISVAGGAYFGKDVYIAELGQGAFTVAGYAAIGKQLTIQDYTNASSTGTGALIIANGGAYVSQNIYVGGSVTATNVQVTSLGSNQLVYTTNSGNLKNTVVSYNTQTSQLVGTITNALIATTATFANTSGFALSFNTNTLVTTAVNAYTATNIVGGTTGSLIYQSSPGQTTTLPIGNNNTILSVSNGILTWGSASGASVGYATTSGFAITFNTATLVTTAVNAYTATYATTSGYAIGFNTSTLVSNAVTATYASYASSFNTATLVSNAVTSTYATNILGGAYGSVLYQTATNQTAALPIGGEGTILAIVNGLFGWANPRGFTVSTASNFNGGQAGSIPFQTASGETGFDDPNLNFDYPYSSNAILNVNKLFVSSTLTSISPTTGALVVAGGVGIGDNLYVAGPIFSNGQQVLTGTGGTGFVSEIKAGPGISVSSATGVITISNIGVLALTAGTDTAISSTTGTITVWNTSTLQTITARGSITNQIITITNSTTATSTNTGALQVVGGIGVGENLYVGGGILVGGNIIPTTSTLSLGTLSNPFADLYLGPNSLNIDTVTLSAKGSTMTIAVIGSAPTYIGTPATLNIGNIIINSATNAISTTTGALQVAGGAGIGKDIRVGNSVFIANSLTVSSTLTSTSSVFQNALYVAGGVGISKNLYVTGEAVFQSNVTFNGTTTYVLSTNTVYSDNIIELHYPNNPGNAWAVNDGNDIGLRIHYYDTQDRNAFLGRDNATGYLEWVVDSGPDNTTNITGTNGTFKLGSIILTNTTASTTTSTGALTVVGGVGIGGDVNVGGTIYRQGISVGYGYTGSIGPTGPLGPTGPQGPKGYDGSVGRAGTCGTPGATGPQGPIGYYGSTGYVGSVGPTGPTGPMGYYGSAGPSGPQGPVGYYGSVGPTGPMGYYGSVGSFTGTTTSTVFIDNLTASTSTTTGALVVAGGVGIGGAAFINTTSYIAGAQIITTATIGNYAAASGNTASSTGTTSTFFINNTTASTGTNSGALTVAGGVGIGGNLNVGGVVSGGGVRTSTTSTPPTIANVGDIWYYQGTDAVYRYQFDGTTSTWVDITGPNLVSLYQYQGNSASTLGYVSAASGNNFITPAVAWSAATPVALTDASTITVDLNTGMNFTCLLTNSVGSTRTLANFVNPKPGQTGWIMFTQSATGNNNVKFGTNWHWPLGSTGTFSTSTFNAVDILFYTILTPTYYLGNMANRVV